MEAVVAFLAGTVAKIYDDGIDNKLIANEYHKKMLETLHCFLVVALSINDFTFSVFITILLLTSYAADKKQFNEPYEFSLLAIYPIFVLLSFPARTYITLTDFLVCMLIFLKAAMDAYFLKEDSSPKKLIGRLFATIIMIVCITYFQLTNGIYNGNIYFIGYCFASTLFQLYSCSHMTIREFAIDSVNDIYKTIIALFVLPKQLV